MSSEKQSNMEGIKLTYDFLKHIITLCTGSILLLSAFLPKLNPQMEYGFLARLSLGGFIISMLACLLASSVIILRAEEGDFTHTKGWEATVETASFYGGAVVFLLSIASLAIFVCVNLPIP